MAKLSDMDPTQYLRAGIIGPPGAGKTALAGTFPKPGFCDLDFGIKTLKAPWYKAKFPEVDVDSIEFETFQDDRNKYGVFRSAEAYWKLVEYINTLVERDDIHTIVLDSATTLSNLAMHVGLELNKASGRSKTLATNMKAILPTMADFGSEMNLIEQLMDQLVTVPKNIVVTFHERQETSDSGATTRIDPQLTGAKLRAKTGRWFDEVWYLDTKGFGAKRRRVLQTDSDNIKKGLKSRLGVPDGLEDPSYAKIIASIRG